MTAKLLDGKAIAATIREELRKKVTASRLRVGLATLLVGSDSASQSYVNGKHRDCAEIGINSIRRELPAEATESQVLDVVSELNTNTQVSGYIVQLPIPHQVDTQRVLEAIDPRKDADGLHPMNLGRLVSKLNEDPRDPLPCTPSGIVELLIRNDVKLVGAEVAILGRGLTVGRPLALLLSRRGIDATVVQLHSQSRDLPGSLRRADIIVAAIGKPHFVKAEWVKPGAAVLDVGISRDVNTGNLVGDVDPKVREIAGHFAPNPGGVGPMTRAMLMRNVVSLAENQSA